MDWKTLLSQVASGETDVPSALRLVQEHSHKDLGFAKIDTGRQRRCGIPEVIFCTGKTPAQVTQIVQGLVEAGQNVLATRASAELFEKVRSAFPDAVFHESARAMTLDVAPLPKPHGRVSVVTAGTSDIPVAEEACLVAERMGAVVERLFDVGVAGVHRLMEHLDTLKASRAVVVVAGMEGALPSVVGGLISRPVIAVPTSIGYGLNLGGAAALLAMLNSCVPGVTVVNVDNGFGAGVAAALINGVEEEPDA